ENAAKYSGEYLHNCIVEDPDFGENLESAIKNVLSVDGIAAPMSNDHKPDNDADANTKAELTEAGAKASLKNDTEAEANPNLLQM
ncbi:1939_t:CDS:2, partial [Diversispora eburnea]